MPFKQKWDLDPIYAGGSSSSELQGEFAFITDALSKIKKQLQGKETLSSVIDLLQETGLRLGNTSAYIHCLLAQNVKDIAAKALQDHLTGLQAEYGVLNNLFNEQLLHLEEGAFNKLLEEKKQLSFFLKERRTQAKEKLSFEQERLIENLSINGYHGWNKMYETLCANIEIDGLSIGQAENKLWDNDRTVRQTYFKKWKDAWEANEEPVAEVLNHLSGFRLKMYEMRGWQSPLKEPLFVNRMKKETLDAMWEAVDKSKDALMPYLEKRAKLLGIDQLSWYDMDAQLPRKGSEIPYDKACKEILKHFESFSPKMASFAKKALEEGWVEAEERSGKRAGGFCVELPKKKESRIFMTYSGSMNNMLTLAHELGHAYHNACVQHLPYFLQEYRMNVAEAASTFAEMVILDKAIEESTSPDEKRYLLDDKIGRSIAFLMNIRARFIFEMGLYDKRKEGMLAAKDLNDLMLEAQKTAYKGALKEWHPHFWAAKMHFYFTDVPFYNFPYTFGYLFSLGIYAKGKKEGKDFAKKYDALLEESGSMDVEALAKKHLGVDLTKKDFWQEAIDLILQDVKQFLAL